MKILCLGRPLVLGRPQPDAILPVMAKKSSSRYHVVSREKTGRLVISKSRSERTTMPGRDKKVGRIDLDPDVGRFADVHIVRPAVRPNKKTETAIRKAVRETLKQKPLGKY